MLVYRKTTESKKLNSLLPIPNIGSPDFQEFSAFLHPDTFIPLIQRTGHISQFYLWEYWEEALIIHWVIKQRFNSKHKIPAPRKVQNYIKPIGVLYSNVFKACEGLHSFTTNEYRNAAHWFCYILREKGLEGVNLGTKRKSLEGLRSGNAMISRYENPVAADTHPHTHRFFELLLSLSEQSDIFRHEVLVPIKKSRQAWATAYKASDYQIGITKGEKEYRQLAGRGSGIEELPSVMVWDEGQKS